MGEFKFRVDKSDSHLNPSRFITTVNRDNNMLNIMHDKRNGRYNRKLNSFTEGKSDIFISDILSIKYKISFVISLNILHIFPLLFFIIFGIFFELMSLEQLSSGIKDGTITNIFDINFLPHFVFVLGCFLVLQDITAKCIQIRIKDKSNKYKKIIFPVASVFFINTPKLVRDEIAELINELKNINPEIRYKEDNIHKMFIIFMVICVLVIILVGVALSNNYMYFFK